jgi:hypothetical protein
MRSLSSETKAKIVRAKHQTVKKINTFKRLYAGQVRFVQSKSQHESYSEQRKLLAMRHTAES